MANRVFYSWQSDLLNNTNRGFINSALERAVKNLKSDQALTVEPVIDRDTAGVPGAPDIASTILKKIDVASAFVCDVSITSRPETGRPCPNPNVLLELGYALKALSSERLILVFNTAYGDVEELPFDLRFKRVLTYRMVEGADPSITRNSLALKLTNALKAIFEHAGKTERNIEHSQFLTRLSQYLTKVILYGEESRQREINPWIQEIVDAFKTAAYDFRELSAKRTSTDLALGDDLENLAGYLDEVVDYPMAMGMDAWEEFNSKVDKAVRKAWDIKTRVVDSSQLSEESKLEIPKLIEEKVRQLNHWLARYDRAEGRMDYRIFSDFLSDVADIGYVLLQVGYYNLDSIEPGLSQVLRTQAQPLHLIMHRYEMGGQDPETFVEDVRKKLQILESTLQVRNEKTTKSSNRTTQ